MIWHARSSGIPVVDISLTARVAHQNHDYSHVPSQRGERWEGPEGDANRALLEFSQGLFSLEFATHRLVDSALHPNRTAGVARRIRVQLLMRKWTVPLLPGASRSLPTDDQDKAMGRADHPCYRGARERTLTRLKLFEDAYERIARELPPRVSARLDRLRPSLRASWGGPLNGQVGRQQIVRDLARCVEFNRVFETGTYRASTTEFFEAVFNCPVYTVEIEERYWRYSRARLAGTPRIHLERGDSRSFLRRHAASAAPDESVFVYLDAHWQADLPLIDELTILATWGRSLLS